MSGTKENCSGHDAQNIATRCLQSVTRKLKVMLVCALISSFGCGRKHGPVKTSWTSELTMWVSFPPEKCAILISCFQVDHRWASRPRRLFCQARFWCFAVFVVSVLIGSCYSGFFTCTPKGVAVKHLSSFHAAACGLGEFGRLAWGLPRCPGTARRAVPSPSPSQTRLLSWLVLVPGPLG